MTFTTPLAESSSAGTGDLATFAGAGAAFEAGIQKIKLYFMIGLPTEKEDDLKGIVDMANRIADLAKNKKRIRITVSLATFIPASCSSASTRS